MAKNSDCLFNEIWLKDPRFSNWLQIGLFSDSMLFFPNQVLQQNSQPQSLVNKPL